MYFISFLEVLNKENLHANFFSQVLGLNQRIFTMSMILTIYHVLNVFSRVKIYWQNSLIWSREIYGLTEKSARGIAHARSHRQALLDMTVHIKLVL